jgi:hypothetical protein
VTVHVDGNRPPATDGGHPAIWAGLLPLLAADPGRRVAVARQTRLRAGVHRLQITGAVRESIVVKRVRNWKSRLEQLLIDRWLPEARLDGLGPPRLAVLAEPDGRYVWHVYDDLGPWGLDRVDVDESSIKAAMSRVADLHARFAGHAMLPVPRFAAGDLGAYFYSTSLRDAARSVSRLRPPALALSTDEQHIRDGLLEHLHVLLDDEPERVRMIEQAAGPETLLHGDLTRANVFAPPAANGWTVRLIDWDHAGVGPAAFDLTTHLAYYAPAERRRVLDAYTAAMAERGFPFGDDVDWARLQATFEAGRLANQIIWVAICILQHGWRFDRLADWSRSLATVVDAPGSVGGAS